MHRSHLDAGDVATLEPPVATPKMRLFQYVDADGVSRTVLVEAVTFRALEAMERKYRRREAKWRRMHVMMPASAIEGLAAKGKAKPPRVPCDGNPWEGPRLTFNHIIGEGSVWTGQPRRYLWCNNQRLRPDQYCLDCDRCGQESRIPTRGETYRRRSYSKSKLKGGRG